MSRKEVSIAVLLLAILRGGGIVKIPFHCIMKKLKSIEKGDMST